MEQGEDEEDKFARFRAAPRKHRPAPDAATKETTSSQANSTEPLRRERSASNASDATDPDKKRGWMLTAYSGKTLPSTTQKPAIARAPTPLNGDEPQKPRAFKQEKRPTEKRLFALLDLDGTLFHMMPESELPGNIGHVTEAVVPLPDGAMRRLIQQQKKSPQGLLVTSLPSTTTAVVDDDSALLEEARHLMAVRRGTRQLLASLRQSGVELRVVTANLLGDAAVGALVDREDADVAASTAAAAAAAAESEPRNDDLAAGNDGDAIVPPPPARGWSGSPVVRVTVVVDRAPGSKRLPEDVAEALRNDPKGTKVVILDDNPTAWEARAKQHIWIVPQFDVRRPLTRAEFDDELGLLERISARCKRFFAAGSPPAPVVPKSLSSTTSPPPAPAPHSRRRRESRMPRSSAEKKVLEKTTEILGRQNGVRDVDDDEEWKEEDEDDPEWEQIVTASRSARSRSKRRRGSSPKESDDDEGDEEVIESAELPS